MSTRKFIEIKFLYFLKPNSILAFFSFSQSGKTRNLQSQSQRSPFHHSRHWKITFSNIPCILPLSTLKSKTTGPYLSKSFLTISNPIRDTSKSLWKKRRCNKCFQWPYSTTTHDFKFFSSILKRLQIFDYSVHHKKFFFQVLFFSLITLCAIRNLWFQNYLQKFYLHKSFWHIIRCLCIGIWLRIWNKTFFEVVTTTEDEFFKTVE